MAPAKRVSPFLQGAFDPASKVKVKRTITKTRLEVPNASRRGATVQELMQGIAKVKNWENDSPVQTATASVTTSPARERESPKAARSTSTRSVPRAVKAELSRSTVAGDEIDIKIVDHTMTRKVMLRRVPTWAQLSLLVQERFTLDRKQAFVLKYADTDGDLIAIVSIVHLASE